MELYLVILPPELENFGGHKYPRLAHVGDRTGLEMIRTLQDHGIHQGIDVHMECTVLALLKDGDRVVGAVAYDRERGRFRVFHARAVVLATGGIGKAYKITSNSWEDTGFKEAVKDIKSALQGIVGDTRKIIIVDLDETLWGGIVGDAGWENLRLGGHDPIGEAYVDFQKALKSFTNRGILLGIASKNEESVALEAIEKNPEMVLKIDDFSCFLGFFHFPGTWSEN